MVCLAGALSLSMIPGSRGFDLDWTIEPIENVVITAVSEPMLFRYEVPSLLDETKDCSVEVLDKNCAPQSTSSVYSDAIYVSSVDTQSQDHRLTAGISINLGTISSSSYYTELDNYRG